VVRWFVRLTPYHGYLKNVAILLLGGWDRHFEVENVALLLLGGWDRPVEVEREGAISSSFPSERSGAWPEPSGSGICVSKVLDGSPGYGSL